MYIHSLFSSTRTSIHSSRMPALSSLILLLALSDAFVVLAMATNQETTPSPSPMNQKVRLHGSEADIVTTASSSDDSGSSPSLSPEGSTNSEASNEQEEEFYLKKHHNRSLDKSVAGGGVILGGLATVFMVAVFCYVRATRRSKRDPESIISPV